ncbi:regulator of chromosome condensation 1/beta-lactamase-inhibitor protein II [Chaetomium tenue]|uniref:Regulator of chromosome condensation 1/beta-lactamase-inhibitor protein II n=1 Tax=Chaetomium tenue TaxID=1854479 RepID=A0ACB7PB40_9PEZI|nr:regulator of chromosome condensation 1/beta-lactamase-inhibitor protein II [Chaetomium globosum]
MILIQALGSNGSGQLGIGHKEDVSTPQPVLLPSSITTANPQPKLKSIAAGGNHTLLLFESGDLLWSGDHTTGACGPVTTTTTTTTSPDDTSSTSSSELTPQFRPVDLTSLPPGSKPIHVAATWTATILVTTTPSPSTNTPTQQVYTFGLSPKDNLGLGPHGPPSTSHPTPIPNFPPTNTTTNTTTNTPTHITSLTASMAHTIAVLSNSEAWGWGNGRKGQLGAPVPATGAVCSPRRIEGVGFPVVRAVCGREFTCLFGAAGSGEMVVLGSDKWGVRAQVPSPLGSLSGGGVGVAGWREVGAGWGSVFVLKEGGELVSWGRDDHGQLARGDIGRVRDIAVGSEHALALTEAGDVMVWGWGEHGNCGPIRKQGGEKGERNKIASTGEGMEITMIGAGCATSWIVFEKPT